MLKRKFGGSLVRAWRRVFANRSWIDIRGPRVVFS